MELDNHLHAGWVHDASTCSWCWELRMNHEQLEFLLTNYDQLVEPSITSFVVIIASCPPFLATISHH